MRCELSDDLGFLVYTRLFSLRGVHFPVRPHAQRGREGERSTATLGASKLMANDGVGAADSVPKAAGVIILRCIFRM